MRYGVEIETLVDRAVELLCADRPELAAALFEAATVGASAKHRSVLLSHQGFCLIPFDPSRALKVISEVLDEADELALRYYNMAVASFMADDHPGAVKFALRATSLEASSNAFLWTLDRQSSLRLIMGDAREYAKSLLLLLNSA